MSYLNDITPVDQRHRDNPIVFAFVADWAETQVSQAITDQAQRVIDWLADSSGAEFVIQAGDVLGGAETGDDKYDMADKTEGQIRFWSNNDNRLTWGTQTDAFVEPEVQSTYWGDGFNDRNTWFQNWVNNVNRWFPSLGNHDYQENPDRDYNSTDSAWSWFQEWFGNLTEQLPSGVTSDQDDPYQAGTTDFTNGNGLNQNFQINWKGIEILNVHNTYLYQNKDCFDWQVTSEDASTYAGPGIDWLTDRVNNSSSRWTILNAHYPMYSSGDVGQYAGTGSGWDPDGDAHSGRKWRTDMATELWDNRKLRFVLSGHDHILEYITKNLGAGVNEISRHFFVHGSCGGFDSPAGPQADDDAYPLDFKTQYRIDDSTGRTTQPHVVLFKASKSHMDVEIWAITAAEPEGVLVYSTAIKHEETGMADSVTWETRPDIAGPVGLAVNYSGQIAATGLFGDGYIIPEGCVGIHATAAGVTATTPATDLQILMSRRNGATFGSNSSSYWEETKAWVIQAASAFVLDGLEPLLGNVKGGWAMLAGCYDDAVGGNDAAGLSMIKNGGRFTPANSTNFKKLQFYSSEAFDYTVESFKVIFWFENGELARAAKYNLEQQLGL